MKSSRKPTPGPAEKKARATLPKFVGIFERKGWLNQRLRIKYQGRKYRIFCSQTGFFAYRINDYCGLSPGIPGWPVCFVTSDQILEDVDLSEFASTEPAAQEWFQSIRDEVLEFI